MRTIYRMTLASLLVMPLGACRKDEAPKSQSEASGVDVDAATLALEDLYGPSRKPEPGQPQEQQPQEQPQPDAPHPDPKPDASKKPLVVKDVGLPNLGATCYLNAFFNVTARDPLLHELAHKVLVAQQGETAEQFEARLGLQTRFAEVLALFSAEATVPGTVIGKELIENFIKAWNHLRFVEKKPSSTVKVTGIGAAEPLTAGVTDDTATILRHVLIALEAPTISVKDINIPFDAASGNVLSDLAPVESVHSKIHELSVNIRSKDAGGSATLQALIDRNFGASAKDVASGYKNANWGEGTFTINRQHWVSHDTKAVYIVLEDRLYFDYNQIDARGRFLQVKNQFRVEPSPEISLPSYDESGHFGKLTMSLETVAVHVGKNSDNGHFYAVAHKKNSDGSSSFKELNDSSVKDGTNIEAMERGARVFLYRVKN